MRRGRASGGRARYAAVVEELNGRPGRPPVFDAARVDLKGAADAVSRLLAALGVVAEHDPELAATARLVAEAWSHDILVGYRMDPAEVLRESLAAGSSDVVCVRDLAVTVMCPHHLLPATGVVHLAYAPGERIVGLGALARLVQCFARRLTLQEALVQHVVDALTEHLGARGAACSAVLTPTCLTARGQRCTGATASSFATRGAMGPGEPLHAAAVALLQAPAPNVERAR